MARVFPAQACTLARGASPVRQLPRLGAAAEVRRRRQYGQGFIAQIPASWPLLRRAEARAREPP